jgi:hypothetical protein
MSSRSPAVQFYFRQFSGDEHVISMKLQEVGCHILLMCAAGASQDGYRLRNDERLLRSICRNIRRSTWKRIFKVMLRGAWKLSQDHKWIEQDGLRRSFLKQKNFSEKQSQNAKRRWDATAMPPHQFGTATEKALASVWQSPAFASASANLTTNPPLPPLSGGEARTIAWGGETIEVEMGRRRRLPAGMATILAGARAPAVVDFLNRKGFPAKIKGAA